MSDDRPGGTRETTVIEGEAEGQPIRIPFVEISGAEDGPVLTIIAGVHGSEYPGILAATRISQEVKPSELRGTLRVVPILNVPAFYGRAEAVCPIDGKNPNRVFPGDPNGTYTDVMNHLVFSEVVEGSDCVINVHGGDIFEALVPYGGIGTVDTESGDKAAASVLERSRELARAYDFPFLVTFASKSSTSYGYDLNTAAMRAHIPAFLAEAGGNGLPDESNVEVHLRGFRNVLSAMGMVDRDIVRTVETRELVSTFWRVEDEGIFTPTVALGDEVKAGQEIGYLDDWFGTRIMTMTAAHDAFIIAIVTTPAAKANAIVYQVAY